jgi:hypothetical protein
MTWRELSRQGRVARESVTREEIAQLRALADRYLADARVEGLSADGRFDRAYGAARALATIVVRASGYRVKGKGGAHYNTFVALRAADPRLFARSADYFDACRAKRNDLAYVAPGIVSEAEVEEILREVPEFAVRVERWLKERWPDLS